MKYFIIPENKIGVGLPVIFCTLPEWLNEERGLSVVVVVKTAQTLQAKVQTIL